jgi:hypothetical protein
MNIKIISEDDYGGAFLKNVIVQLRSKKMVGNIVVKATKPMCPLCNFQLDRILKVFDNSCDKIIIILDSDDPQNYKSRYANVKRHVPDGLKTPVEIILMDYEIEEWICISKDIKWKHHKPSEELKLKLKFGYIKSSLPKYAAELDFDKLRKNSKSFKYFIGVGIKANYMHSEIETLERIEIIRSLRLAEFDVLVGINLLREGLEPA